MRSCLLFAGACAGLLSLPPTACAALGGAVEPAAPGQVKVRAAARPDGAQASYTIHERQTEAGTTVREYADANGTVFAVRWDGPAKPDVRRLLGNYFSEYTTAANEGRGTLRRAGVERNGLVVRSGGRLRAFSGLAYLPAALPAGVTPESLE